MPIIYPEEQTSAFLLCASETLWFNPSCWNVNNEGLPQSLRGTEKAKREKR